MKGFMIFLALLLAGAFCQAQTADLAIGTNAFPWTPRSYMGNMPWVRTYISAGWVWRPDGIYVEPFYQAATQEAYGLDTYLRNMKAAGSRVVLCIHQTPEWFLPTGRTDGANDYPPCRPNADRSSPESYREAAEFFFQISARYGQTAWPESALKLSHGPVFGSTWIPQGNNPPVSGLGTLSFIEPWNEPDKWWKRGGPEASQYWEPFWVAAYLSAVYDGHCGTMGPGVGIKTADPGMIVVMPGLTGFDARYFDEMKKWWTVNRADRRPPFDVVNVHHYGNRGNVAGQWPPTWVAGGGVAPLRDANFLPGLAAFSSRCAALGLPLWVTEFGFDSQKPVSGPASWQYPDGVGAGQELQAAYNLQTWLEYMAAGVAVSFVFNGNDEPGFLSGGLYQSCGLLTASTAPDPYSPKPAYINALRLRASLAGCRYSGGWLTEDGGRVLQFAGPGGKKVFAFYSVSGAPVPVVIRSQTFYAGAMPQFYTTKKTRLRDRGRASGLFPEIIGKTAWRK